MSYAIAIQTHTPAMPLNRRARIAIHNYTPRHEASVSPNVRQNSPRFSGSVSTQLLKTVMALILLAVPLFGQEKERPVTLRFVGISPPSRDGQMQMREKIRTQCDKQCPKETFRLTVLDKTYQVHAIIGQSGTILANIQANE